MRSRKHIFHSVTFAVLLLVITIVALEVASPLVLYFLNGRWLSRAHIQQTLDFQPQQVNDKEITAHDFSQPWIQPHVLHPYIGFAYNYDLKQYVFGDNNLTIPVNEYGFFGDAPTKRKADNEVTIAIMGGSVAKRFFLYARDTLKHELKKTPNFADKEIQIVSVALGGMKQPQQLMALNYFLSLGIYFDIVINLDGFNEVVMPFCHNVPFGVSPYYPRNWWVYSAKALDIQTIRLASEIYEKKDEVEKWRSVISKNPFRHSNFFLALWHSISKRKNDQQLSLQEQLSKHTFKRVKLLTAQETGPPYTYRTRSDIFADFARLWKRTSIQMWKLCQAYGIEYFHFLQPNQYVAGTKKLTDWEKRFVFADPGNSYRMCAERGYPYLIDMGKDLKNMELPFVDLTEIFKQESGTIYIDTTGHYNQRGNDLLAVKIANVIADSKFFYRRL